VERSGAGETHTTHFLDAWSEVRDGKLVRFIVHGGQRVAQLADGNGVPADAKGASATAAYAQDDEPPLARRASSTAPGRLSLFALMGLFAAIVTAISVGRKSRLVLSSPRRHLAPLGLFVAVVALVSMACSSGDDAHDLEGTIQVLTDADELLFDDAIGSLTEETSGGGTPRSTFGNYPYGLTRFDTSPQTRKYANAPQDGGVGLDSMGARWYAPDLGVWTSADPVAVDDPTRGVGHLLGASNPYSYAGQNPIIATDPHGHWVHIAIGAAVGLLVGGGMEAYHQISETGHVENWGRVAGHAATGAVAGALIAAIPSPATVGGAALLLGGSAAVGAAEGTANRLIDSGGKSAGTLHQAFHDGLVSAATAGVGSAAGALVKKTAAAVLRSSGSGASGIGSALREFAEDTRGAGKARGANPRRGANPTTPGTASKGSPNASSSKGRAPEFSSGKMKEDDFPDHAEKFLGAGYKEASSGRYVSADGMRQVRYGAHEVNSGTHHAHFEAYDAPGGRVIENSMVELIP